jgi:hypothetical protein
MEESKNQSDATTPKVTGIGGIFFFLENPKETKDWYARNLGLEINDWGSSSFESRNIDKPEQIESTQWCPFKKGDEYFSPSKKEFMINYRVQNIEGLLEKLKEMQTAFMEEAEKYKVFPFDDRYIDRVNPENRPNLNKGRTKFVFHQGGSRITEGMAPNMKNTSFTITAEVEVKAGQEGMIITQGGYFAGLALMLQKGKPTFAYAFSHYPNHKWSIQSPTALTAGKHTIVVKFDYAGGGVGKAAKATLLVDGKQAATGDIPKTVPSRFSADETLDVGEDFGTPVNRTYDAPFTFQGKIDKVTVDLKS